MRPETVSPEKAGRRTATLRALYDDERDLRGNLAAAERHRTVPPHRPGRARWSREHCARLAGLGHERGLDL
ncbi:hypothetical protein [Streptomyces sp. NPDC001388]|uniref:hypothetical protein n=1 Tax=Streptomyces sp. NPDC001388 TaxID=3364568 RepID=UPI00367F9347